MCVFSLPILVEVDHASPCHPLFFRCRGDGEEAQLQFPLKTGGAEPRSAQLFRSEHRKIHTRERGAAGQCGSACEPGSAGTLNRIEPAPNWVQIGDETMQEVSKATSYCCGGEP